MDDIPFMDALQRMHTRQVGWMPTAQFEGKIRLGHVLIAEEVCSSQKAVGGENSLPTVYRLPPTLAGYIIGNDRYFKRDDLGIIYQVNVSPGKQRGLIGAALVQAMFDRAAWGCRLFCCWCAQDIEANHFWESLGFVPLAFRTGSRTKGKGSGGKAGPRVHIFWQKRIRAGDVTTPYWYPAQTGSGSIREDRLVLPIPPGTHWSDAKPVVLPGAPRHEGQALALEDGGAAEHRRSKPARKAVPVKKATADVSRGGLRFAEPKAADPTHAPRKRKTAGQTPAPRKNDPKLVAAARELRDRWLEEVNAGRYLPGASGAKYDVTRLIEPVAQPAPLLEARLAA
jgi:hypothetical protein